MRRSFRAELTVVFVCLLSLALRWPIASHDVHHYVGPDEGEVVENVLEMLKTGDFDHRHPGYPGLHFYIQMIPAALQLGVTGKTVAELPRDGFYLWARRTTLLAGVATAGVTYAIGVYFLSPWAAACAAALVALSPLAARESAVVNPDLMLSLFSGLAVFFALRLLEEHRRRRYLTAGAAVGLATAIKYTGAFALLPYLVASLVGGKREWERIFLGLAAAGLAFVAASPYTLLRFPAFVRGLGMHLGYYRASDMNAAGEVLRVLLTRGLGLVAGVASVVAILAALRRLEPRRLVVVGYPLSYLLVFAFFDRAFPRHALPLLAPFALFSGDLVDRLRERGGRARAPLALAAALLMLAAPLLESVDLSRRARRPTAADRAARWIASEIPPGSRILEDQFTPRLDDDRYRVKRLRVEERVFLGNFDWVVYSGYPPGIETTGLREVARFSPDGALGDTVLVYQVPDRESLVPTVLTEGQDEARIEAGELPFFGDGFDPPSPGAYGTARLSRGAAATIFVVLPSGAPVPPLEVQLELASAVAEFQAVVEVEWNGHPVGRLAVDGEEPTSHRLHLPSEASRPGLNRLMLRFPELVRVDRRHRDAAIRFYALELSRS